MSPVISVALRPMLTLRIGVILAPRRRYGIASSRLLERLLFSRTAWRSANNNGPHSLRLPCGKLTRRDCSISPNSLAGHLATATRSIAVLTTVALKRVAGPWSYDVAFGVSVSWSGYPIGCGSRSTALPAPGGVNRHLSSR